MPSSSRFLPAIAGSKERIMRILALSSSVRGKLFQVQVVRGVHRQNQVVAVEVFDNESGCAVARWGRYRAR